MTETNEAATLSSSDCVDLRRFCWYPAVGTSGTGADWWRLNSYFQSFEYRISVLSLDEISILKTMLERLRLLEIGPENAADNLDTDKAAVWERNKREVFERIALYNQQRMELVGFLGVVPGPMRASAQIRLTV